MLDFRIETFLMLCDTRSYTRTAQLLCITQPAVTQHVQYLEGKYGGKLFRYEGRVLKLTEKGQRLAQLARSMRQNARRIEEELAAVDAKPVTSRVGATKTIGEYLIGDMMAHYLRDPARNVALSVANTRQLLRMLDGGELDFAMVEGYFDKQRYGSSLLRVEPFTGICAKDHPFAGNIASFEALMEENLLVREPGSGTRDVLEHLLLENNLGITGFRRVTEISSFGVIKDLVAAGQGITFAYHAIWREDPRLALFQLPGRPVSHAFNYVYLQDSLLEDSFLAFCRSWTDSQDTGGN